MDALNQARRYLNAIPPASEGDRNNALNRAAYALIERFSLPEADFHALMLGWAERCTPPIPSGEALRTIHSAYTAACAKGVNGSKATSFRTLSTHSKFSSQQGRGEVTQASLKTFKLPDSPLVPIPSPLQDGARALLLAAFAEGDAVRLCLASTGEDGREIPRDAGITLTREEWLQKLDAAAGNPNAFLSSSERNGIYVSINPFELGGSRDTDVTAFRHCLLEFDTIPLEEQWNLILHSKIPVTAVIHSGKRSLHAWVRVDASDRAEYEARVKLLYAYFAPYRPDDKNKNPSRFSRLPSCVRSGSRQELIALKLGAAAFTQWQAEQEIHDLGDEIQVKHLLDFVPSTDPNNVLGNRWLCRGGSCLFVGQSGIGKSSLAMQLAILWALERPAFGICPQKPLRSLFVQAENDLGDIAEMFQGVWLGMKLPGPESPDTIRQVQNNLLVRSVTTYTGLAFCEALRRLIDYYKPDLVWLDPLLSYIGDDISKQSVCSQFLRNWLNPISQATGVIWMILHHTGKPPKDPKSKSHWKSGDYAYEGTGSSELTNWARAVCVLHRLDESLFELKLAKRGPRAGARDFNMNPTTSLYLRHSTQGICWEQTDRPPEEQDSDSTSVVTNRSSNTNGRPQVRFDFDAFLSSISGEHFTVSQLVERARKFSGASERTAYSRIVPELKKRMTYDAAFRTYCG